MESINSICLFTDNKGFDSSILNLKNAGLKVSFSLKDLFKSIRLDSIIVLSDTDRSNICYVLDEVKKRRMFNPIVAFVNGLNSADVSAMIRCGAYSVYGQNEIENLEKIIEKEKEGFQVFYKEKARAAYVNLIVENVDDLFFEFDADLSLERKWRLNYIGGQVEKLGGVTAQQCLDNQDLWWDMIHPDDIQGIVESTKTAILELKPQIREYRISHARTGEYFWMQDRVSPVYNSLGKVTQLYGVARRIHETKLQEIELNEQRKFNENILATSPSILYILDYASQLMINGLDRFADFLGYSIQEIEKMPNGVYSLIHKNDVKEVEVQEDLLSKDKEGKVIPVEIRLRHKDGKFIWVRVYSKIFERDSTGKPIKEIGSVVDISRTKESENIFKRIALNSNVGIVIIQDEKIKFANPGASNLLGYSNIELVENHIIKFIAPGRSALTREVFLGLFQKKFKQKTSDQILLKKGGGQLEVNITSTLIAYRGRKAIMSVFLDDSLSKQAERTFRTLFDRSEDLIYILNEKSEFVDVNQSVIDKYGYSKEEIMGKTPEVFGVPNRNDMNMVQDKSERAWKGEITRFDW